MQQILNNVGDCILLRDGIQISVRVQLLCSYIKHVCIVYFNSSSSLTSSGSILSISVKLHWLILNPTTLIDMFLDLTVK